MGCPNSGCLQSLGGAGLCDGERCSLVTKKSTVSHGQGRENRTAEPPTTTFPTHSDAWWRWSRLWPFYRQRLWRLGLPLLGWTVFYAYYYHLFRGDPLSLGFTLQRIIFDQPYEHLYFLWLLLQLAFWTPALQQLVHQLHLSTTLALVGLFFVMMIFWSPSRFLLSFFIPYLGYYLFGGVASHLPRSAWWWGLGLVGWLSSSVVIAVGTGWAFTGQLPVVHPLALYEYAHPLVAVQSVSLFVVWSQWARSADWHRWLTTWQRPLRWLSDRCFGIYLVHVVVLDVLRFGAGGQMWLLQQTWIALPVLLLLTFVLSISLSWGQSLVANCFRVGGFRLRADLALGSGWLAPRPPGHTAELPQQAERQT